MTSKLLYILVTVTVFTSTCEHVFGFVPELLKIGRKFIKPAAADFIDLENVLAKPIENLIDTATNIKAVISAINEEDFFKQIEIGNKHPDIKLSLVEMLQKYGYNVEVYTVKTEDGYTIILYRIPGDGDSVLISHGLLSNAADWLTLGPDQGLPYLLANQGYDVWLIDCRGAVEQTLPHTHLSHKDEKFWDYSWNEIGRYDFAAAVDVIIYKTGKTAIKFVGHSQGTTSLMVLLSERPEYNKKISVAALLSPIVFMGNQKSPLLNIVSPGAGLLKFVASIMGMTGVLNRENMIINFIRLKYCGNTLVASVICSQMMYVFTGFNYPQFNVTNYANIYSHAVGGSSLKQLVHYAQGITTGKFRQYDLGPLKNFKVYGSLTPSDYRLENVNTSLLFLYGSGNDLVSMPKDIDILFKKLPSHVVAEKYRVPQKLFCHTDFMWAKDAKTLLYDKLLDFFAKY